MAAALLLYMWSEIEMHQVSCGNGVGGSGRERMRIKLRRKKRNEVSIIGVAHGVEQCPLLLPPTLLSSSVRHHPAHNPLPHLAPP